MPARRKGSLCSFEVLCARLGASRAKGRKPCLRGFFGAVLQGKSSPEPHVLRIVNVFASGEMVRRLRRSLAGSARAGGAPGDVHSASVINDKEELVSHRRQRP